MSAGTPRVLTVRRVRPDDHFMILTDTAETPIQIGALLVLAVADCDRDEVFAAIRDHFLSRLPATPLLSVLREHPTGYDSDVWLDIDACDPAAHFERVSGAIDEHMLHTTAAANGMRRLDLGRPPFRVIVYDDIGDGRCAVQITVHHSVTDGVGFQTLLSRLSDDVEPASTAERSEAERTPTTPAEVWAGADERFEAEAGLRDRKRAEMQEALAMLKGGTLAPRSRTPVLKLSGPTSGERSYTRISVPLQRVKTLSKRFDATINDIFLALAATAIRRYLIEIDDLPETPIVVNSARSYRRPEHRDFENRIVAMHPHLATTVADPRERLAAIMASMADERARTRWDEAMLDQPERPFGPRDRRAKFAERARDQAAVLPGNVTLSNVPGPPGSRSFAGFTQLSNHPVPLLGSGRFLNITSRRNGDSLDMGVMADPTKIADVERIARYVVEALDEYEALAEATDTDA